MKDQLVVVNSFIDSKQYIEALIKLVELNKDQTWIETFTKLRAGGHLPGGGAGSLNDWGPSYGKLEQHVWYGELYKILRFLFDNKLPVSKVSEYKPLKNNNIIDVIRCLNCNGSYQHPNIFESHIALNFYSEEIEKYADKEKLGEIIEPENCYNSDTAIAYRDALTSAYNQHGIAIYNFVLGKYVCPHCERERQDTNRDYFKIELDDNYSIVLSRKALNPKVEK